MPPVLGPRSPSKIALVVLRRAPSAPPARRRTAPAATAPRPPGAPPPPRWRRCRSARPGRSPPSAASASATSSATVTPLPAASPSALITTPWGRPARRPPPAPRPGVCTRRQRAVGTPASSIACLANAFDPSRRAAAAVGPKASCPRSASASTRPPTSGASGPTTVKSTRSRSHGRDEPVDVVGGHVQQPRVGGDAGVAGRAQQLGPLRRAGQRAHERMLAPAAAHDQHPHGDLRRSPTARR